MNPDAVATAFVEHYYSTFDSNRAGLANLYQENSMLSFEGVKIQGAQHIVAKLTSLPFQQCKHQINTVDCQPSGPIGGMLVFVSGNLQLPGEEHVLKFSQVFPPLLRALLLLFHVLFIIIGDLLMYFTICNSISFKSVIKGKWMEFGFPFSNTS
uniref:Nuclear transport factor 2-like n=1 Tax=Nicotiana sylvestris TaxID=4096 RepID=A0A1U7UXY2_NICSY|nr:PREDICTED: nuclear transport factor 2-like [Nicotiana sylvestris]